MEHPVYSSCSKGSGWTDPSSAGFVSPIERDKIDAGRSPHFISRGGPPQGGFTTYVCRLRSLLVDVRNWVLWRGSGHPLSSVDRAQLWACPYGMWWTVPLEQVCLQVLRFSHGVVAPVTCTQPCHLSPISWGKFQSKHNYKYG